MPECFPDPDRYDPTRYEKGREEDKQLFAWIPFGGGRHRCVGAAFAMMQLKGIFSDLLRSFEFELVEPPECYRNDHSKMVVQLQQPCRVRYRRRGSVESVPVSRRRLESEVPDAGVRIRVDLDLCQGHRVCVGEAPEIFDVERVDGTDKVVLKCETVGPEQRRELEQAVRHCPTHALRLEEN